MDQEPDQGAEEAPKNPDEINENETEELDEAEIERRQALEKLQMQMFEQQNIVQEHRKKLVLLEKKVAQKKQEEEELGKNFFGVAATISSVGTQADGVASAKEYSVEELEKLQDALKQSLMLQQNKLKFLINSNTRLSKEAHCDRVCEAFFESEKTWFAALMQDVDEEN